MSRQLWASALAAAALLALSSFGVAQAQEADELLVTRVDARFRTHVRSGSARHRLRIAATFPDTEALSAFDPKTDALLITVGDTPVLAADPVAEPRGFRLRRRRGALRTWRYRVRGDSGGVGVRSFAVRVRRGRVTLSIRRASLRSVLEAGPDDVDIAVTVGDSTAAATLSFQATSFASGDNWRYRDFGGPGPGPGPGPIGGPTLTSLAFGSLANTQRPDLAVARTSQELVTLWASLGNPGALPQVDFPRDMVVAISSVVRGPGAFPPALDIVALRDSGGSLQVDWQLRGCEFNLCPGAPGVPCPTVTPFQVFRTENRPGTVRTVQLPTLGVCP